MYHFKCQILPKYTQTAQTKRDNPPQTLLTNPPGHNHEIPSQTDYSQSLVELSVKNMGKM